MDGFTKEASGPNGIFGVFDDDGETGYLYLYEPHGRGIFAHVRVYSEAQSLKVIESDVVVQWSFDLGKCGVTIWGKMRAIIYLQSGQSGRVLIENRGSPGIGDNEWLSGFEA